MLVVWGRRVVEKMRGYVADICPVCRDLEAFALREVMLVDHFCFIPLGRGHSAAHLRCCQNCSMTFDADPRRYSSVAKSRAPARTLLGLTFPNFNEVEHQTLAIEHLIKTNPAAISQSDRHALLLKPILALSPMVERRMRTTHADIEVGVTVAASVALVVIAQYAALRFAPNDVDRAVLGTFLVCFAVVVWQFVMTGGRYVRRVIAPPLAKCISPLTPTVAEVERALTELRHGGHKIAFKLRAEQLVEGGSSCSHAALL